jgi:flavin-dependent dehydrogenase
MKALWPQILGQSHVRDALGPSVAPESPHKAWPIPARVDHATLSAGRALFVGDAACATDPMTGEGIGQALLTGILAARAIDAGGPRDARRVRDLYETAVGHHLFTDHHMSMLLVRALRHRKGARAAVRVAGTSAWTRRNFARWLFEDYPRGVIATPSRWRLGLFTGAGAYR